MFALGAFPVRAGIQNDDHKYYKTQTQKHENSGLVFPDLFNAARQLGPIHVSAPYTSAFEK